MKRYLGSCLSFWHAYKTVSTTIWQTWLCELFAPLFHFLHPRDAVFVAPKLRVITTYFHYLMLAYPSFKTQLHEKIKSGKDLRICDNVLKRLHNIQDLCEFFIPTVSHV